MVPRSRFLGVRHCGHDGGRLLSATRVLPRSDSAPGGSSCLRSRSSGRAFASLSLLTPRLWHLYATFVILGMVANGTAQMAYARTVSSWFARRRGVALAVVMTGGAVGAMVLPPVAQSLIDSDGLARRKRAARDHGARRRFAHCAGLRTRTSVRA